MKYLYVLILAVLTLTIAQAKTEHFEVPSIKDDFCGEKLSPQWCQCAFHNTNCEAVNSDKSSANTKVVNDYRAFVEKEVERFARDCMANDGIYSVLNYHCEYCDDDEVAQKGVCVDEDDMQSLEERYNLPPVERSSGSKALGYVILGEGEFFIYSQGLGKWIGPVKEGRTLYEGDVLHTTTNGRAKIRLGNTNMLISERTTFNLPTPREERHILVRGIINIWETVKRLATNQPFEVEGAKSIAGIKGTDFIMQVSDDGTETYTVLEGDIEVWVKGEPGTKQTVGDEESVRVTENGIEDEEYEWEKLLNENDWAGRDISEPTADVELLRDVIDPDLVSPTEAAYTGDLVGELELEEGSSSGKGILWLVIIVLLLGGGVYYFKFKGNKK